MSDESLSIVLPVHNVESTLAAQIRAILDVVSDLVHRLEILIVDDGSTDRTDEIAWEIGAIQTKTEDATAIELISN